MCIKYCEFYVNNGILLKAYQNKSLHSINMSLYFKAGVIYESAEVSGISHLLEHLFFRRSRGITQKQLYYQMESIGGTLRAATYADFIRFDISVCPKYFLPAFEIITGVLANNEWTEEDINKEKSVVLKQIEFKSPPTFSEYEKNRYLRGLPLAKPIMGSKTSVAKLNQRTIESWRNKFFTPSNSCFVITGNFTNDHLKFAMEELSKYPNCSNQLIRNTFVPKEFGKHNEKSDYIIDTDWDVSDVSISFDVDIQSNNIYYVDFLSSIIGEGVGSRLSLLLREELSLTDEIYSRVDIFPDTRKITIEFSTNNNSIEKALVNVFHIISNVKKEIAEEDIEASKVFFTDNLRWLLDEPRELNFMLGWKGFILDEPFSDIEDLVEKYSSITSEKLIETAQRIFTSNNLIITITNNKAIFKKSKLINTILNCRNSLLN